LLLTIQKKEDLMKTKALHRYSKLVENRKSVDKNCVLKLDSGEYDSVHVLNPLYLITLGK